MVEPATSESTRVCLAFITSVVCTISNALFLRADEFWEPAPADELFLVEPLLSINVPECPARAFCFTAYKFIFKSWGKSMAEVSPKFLSDAVIARSCGRHDSCEVDDNIDTSSAATGAPVCYNR
jgi:hypothetical protein